MHQCHRIGCFCFIKWLVAVIDNHTFCHKVACVVWIADVKTKTLCMHTHTHVHADLFAYIPLQAYSLTY